MATVYKILSPCLHECYVGSTTARVESRWKNHRCKANNTNSKSLFEKHGIENCKFVVLEVCPLEERRKKEQWWLEHSVGAVNKCNAIENKEDNKAHYKEWYEANKKRLLAYKKVYREENKDKHREYMKEYMKQRREAKKASE